MTNIFYLLFAGFVSGIVGGMGMGGGTLLIPILTIFLQFQQKSAQAINLISFIPMSITALIIHVKNKLVDFKIGIPIIICGVIFSVMGSLIASNLENEILQKIFAVFLLMVGINQAFQTILLIKKVKTKQNKEKKYYKYKIYIK